MKNCIVCGKEVEKRVEIDGKIHKVNNKRRECLVCRPLKSRPNDYKRSCRHTEEELREAVANSRSVSEVFKKLGIHFGGGNYTTFYARCEKYKISMEHFTGQGWLKGGKNNSYPAVPLDIVLRQKSTYQSYKLKKRLLAEGYFERKCYRCNRTEWEGEPIPIQLHHIDGDRTNNEITNLTLLCPNCHALTPNFAAKNIGKYAKYKNAY